jgi:DNA-binding response OmpR family regulator
VTTDQLPLAGKSILVIENELLIAMSVESLLGEAGAAAVTAVSSIAQAERALENASYDATVVDFYLPDGHASRLIEI